MTRNENGYSVVIYPAESAMKCGALRSI